MAERVCPWWMGYFLLNPMRRLAQNPGKIVAPYVKEGMTVLEIGPGMGYFTLPLARLVGPKGKIVCVDIQEKMLKGLKRRAGRAGLAERITAGLTTADSLGIREYSGRVDFALLFAVVHEIPDQEGLFSEVHSAMKGDALLLVSEPTGHLTAKAFRDMLALAERTGFTVESTPLIRRNHSVLLKKQRPK